MKYIAEFFNFSKRKKSELDDFTGEYSGEEYSGEYPKHLKQLDRQNGDTYCILTQEQVDKGEKFDEPISVVKNGYHFFYKNINELEELENKYPVGGKYRNETILQTHILNSKNINF